jgi:hypothetical protein
MREETENNQHHASFTAIVIIIFGNIKFDHSSIENYLSNDEKEELFASWDCLSVISCCPHHWLDMPQ